VHFAGFLKDLVTSNSILVINKSDLGVKNIIGEFKKHKPIIISIKKEKNLDKLIYEIKNKLKNQFINSENILITRDRHRQHLEQCVFYLKNFDNKNEDEDFDKAAEDLRLATRHLGMVVGKVDVEEVLGTIFNDFCIGK
jgi:tRNA modification GTPase